MFPPFANFFLCSQLSNENDKHKKVAKALHIEASLFENSEKLMKYLVLKMFILSFHLQENMNNLNLESA